MGVHRNVMVGLIDELEERDLVRRERHPRDRRAHQLRLTDRAHSVLAQANAAVDELEDEIFAGFDSRRAFPVDHPVAASRETRRTYPTVFIPTCVAVDAPTCWRRAIGCIVRRAFGSGGRRSCVPAQPVRCFDPLARSRWFGPC